MKLDKVVVTFSGQDFVVSVDDAMKVTGIMSILPFHRGAPNREWYMQVFQNLINSGDFREIVCSAI